MKYTKKYEQVSKKAARSKFNRMQSGAGRYGQASFECGFSTWWWGKDLDDNASPYEIDNASYAIFVSSTYHPESTLDEMYRTNCKKY
jgi:hypothetical protein